MISIKNEREVAAMRVAGSIARQVLEETAVYIQPGMTTRQVDEFAAEAIRRHGARSAFLGYRKYPCNICISVNDEVVHGLAGDRRVEDRRRHGPGGLPRSPVPLRRRPKRGGVPPHGHHVRAG